MVIFMFLCVLLNMFSLFMYVSKTDINSILNFSENPITIVTIIALSCLMFVFMGSKRGFHQVSLYEDFRYIKKLYHIYYFMSTSKNKKCENKSHILFNNIQFLHE